MTNRIFFDTSFLYSFIDQKEIHHKSSVKLFDTLKFEDEILVTSNYIISELITLFRARNFQLEKIIHFVNNLWNEKYYKVLRVTKEIDLEAWKMMRQYKDQDFSFTDCTSFILMKKNNIKKAFSLDKHFITAGFELAE